MKGSQLFLSAMVATSPIALSPAMGSVLAERIIACSFGATLAMLYVWYKARKEQEGATDTVIQVMIALTSAMSIGFLFGPTLARYWPVEATPETDSAAAMVMSLFAYPAVNFILSGKLLVFLTEKFGAAK